jgi:hypothetical protein
MADQIVSSTASAPPSETSSKCRAGQESRRKCGGQAVQDGRRGARSKLVRERPDLADQIQSSVTEVTGALQSKFGPASKSYFNAKRAVTAQHQYGNLK